MDGLVDRRVPPVKTSGTSLRLLAGLTVAVCFAVAATHWPALSSQALSLDDDQYLTRNTLVQNPGWDSARRFFTEVFAPSTVEGYYQPLTMVALMADYALGGRPTYLRPFRRTSLALHVANTALIILFIYALFGEPWTAAMVGLLFGVHPMTVEPVQWIGEHKTLLATFFALCSLITYVRFAKGRRWRWYVASAVAYLLALLSKPTATPLPLLMLLLDYWPLHTAGMIRCRERAEHRERGDVRELLLRTLEKVPLFGVGLVSAVITYISQHRSGGTVAPTDFSTDWVPLVLCHNVIFYLYKVIWPVNLSPYHPFPTPVSLQNGAVLAGVVGTCVLVPLLLISLRWTRALLTGWLFFFVGVFPALGVVGFTIVIASDKYAYLPAVGILLIAAWLLGRLFRKPRARGVIVASIVLLAGAEVRATRQYLQHWTTSESLFSYMLELTPRAPPLRNQMGLVLAEGGKITEALVQFRLALEDNPWYEDARNNLATLLIEAGRLDEAIQHCRFVLEHKPESPKAHLNLGMAFVRQGHLDEAMEHLGLATRLAPNMPEAHLNLGNCLLKLGRLDQAAAAYEQALLLRPGYAEAYNNLGTALRKQGHVEEALARYRAALRVKPDYADAHCNLGGLLLSQGRLDEATAHCRSALQVDPNHASAKACLQIVAQQKAATQE